MQKAYFSTENKGHYGLALNAYSQTTSPIRRLMDLIIEYILDDLDKIVKESHNFIPKEYKADKQGIIKEIKEFIDRL